jgi:hypothetical protein
VVDDTPACFGSINHPHPEPLDGAFSAAPTPGPAFGAGPFSSGQHHDTLWLAHICPRETTMAEAQDNSPEYIAYRLMRDIAETEGKYFRPSEREPQKAITRKWILETYAECLMVVKDPHNIKKQTQKS